MRQYNYVAGLDVGNGYTKGTIAHRDDIDNTLRYIDIPSGVTLMTRPNFVPVKDDKAKEELDDFYNRLDASFTTELVSDNYRRLFGERSLSASNGAFEQFDVKGNRSKAEQSLSKILVLGIIGASAVQDYFDEHGELPDPTGVINVNVNLGLALPITEYLHYRHSYISQLESGVHTVTIHNFETPIHVKVVIDNVHVLAEGASAVYAINDLGKPLVERMLHDLENRGYDLGDIDADDVLGAKDVVGIDIGEGTVNYPVFSQGRFNPDASSTFNQGYGSVLDGAIRSMSDQGFNAGFSSRKQLAAYLEAGEKPMKKNHYAKVQEFVHEEILFFAKAVAESFGHTLAGVAGTTELVYVYGGGSGPIKDVLYPLILDKVSEMGGADAFPVLYLDASYSRHLNREGLFLAAQLGL